MKPNNLISSLKDLKRSLIKTAFMRYANNDKIWSLLTHTHTDKQ